MRQNDFNKAEESKILKLLSQNHDLLIYVNDPVKRELKYMNENMARLLNLNPCAVSGMICHSTVWGNDGPCSFCPLVKLQNNDGSLRKGTVFEWEFKSALLKRWFWRKDSVVEWIDGSLVHLQIGIDITLRKGYEEQLQLSASIDAMTGTFNRDWGYKLLERAFDEARISHTQYSLCFFDLDRLKETNDAFGHDAGDEMITGIIGAVRKSIRKNDFVCRWGGDEFIILLKCDLKQADTVIQKIQAELDVVNQVYPAERPRLAFSYGIADIFAENSIEKVITAADRAMYENKTKKYKSGTTRRIFAD